MSTAKPKVRHTYGSRPANVRPVIPNPASDTSLFSSPFKSTEATSSKRKRPLTDLVNGSPPKRKAMSRKVPATKKAKETKKAKLDGLTQLHFCVDQTILRTCPLCDLSYTRGAPDDETLHKTHCARVRKGMEWGREEDKELGKADGYVVIVEEDVVVSHGERGRIVAVKPSTVGRLGAKISGCLKTANLALSAPDMPTSLLESCKVYLFLLRSPGCTREKIVGCVVAQRISSAMQIATLEEVSVLENAGGSLVHVEGNLFCKPESLPTPMGIPRLFVSSAHRRKGIARALLSAAAKTFIHGCELEPAKGEIAFSQPTSMGRVVMEKWGGGGVRVYKE